MKATGIVRRIDDLGRVVIPKEIRRTQRIRTGDPLEIWTSGEGEVIFKKYSAVGELSGLAEQYAQVLARSLAAPVLICDRDHVVAAAGPGRRDCLDRRITRPLEQLLEQRVLWTHPAKPEQCIWPCEGAERHVLAAAPVLTEGDVAGAVLLLGEDKRAAADVQTARIIGIAAALLAKQLGQ